MTDSPAPIETQITFSPERDQIVAAIARIQGQVGSIRKDGQTTFGDKFRYVTCDQLVEALRPHLAKEQLAVTYSIVQSADLSNRTTQKGGEMHRYRVKMQATVSHPSGQWAAVVSIGEGEDSTDKAPYKAHTGARKYALISLFNISTDDDPENDRGTAAQPAARPQPARPHTQPASRPAPSGGGALPPQGTRTFVIAGVDQQTGTNKQSGKPWTKFNITAASPDSGEEIKLSTFSQAHADIAQGCAETGCMARITYQYDAKWKSYTLNDIAAEEGGEPPAEEAPAGDEGQITDEEAPF